MIINRFFIFSFFRILRGVKFKILAIFADFRTFLIHFLTLTLFFPLWSYIKKLDTKQCLKCIIKCLYQFVFKFDHFFLLQIYIFVELLAILWFWPLDAAFFYSRELFFSLWGYIKKKFWHYAVLEIYHKMFAPVSFQVWPIFRLQIDIFAELLLILWFWPLHGAFSGSQAIFFPL